MSVQGQRAWAFAAIVVVLGTVVWGFSIVGSPDLRRLERLDERRIGDLRDIHWAIQRQVRGLHDERVLKRPLPRTLAEVAANARNVKLVIVDPESGAPYEYFPRETTYALCATFSTVRDHPRDAFWNHGARRRCFHFDALDPP